MLINRLICKQLNSVIYNSHFSLTFLFCIQVLQDMTTVTGSAADHSTTKNTTRFITKTQ